MQVIGHRGAPLEAFENSFRAFECAIDGGADRIELDVHLSKDNFLVVSHDPDLKHIAGNDMLCKNITREDFSKLRLKDGSVIPFLDQVFERYLTQVEFNVEIKEDNSVVARVVGEHIKRFDCADRVVVSSFQPEMVRYFAVHYPEVRRACLWGPDAKWPKLADYSPIKIMEYCDAQILHPYVKFVDGALMDQACHRGWKIFPYTSLKKNDEFIGREALWNKLVECGVEGLCTNYPRELKQWLLKREKQGSSNG